MCGGGEGSRGRLGGGSWDSELSLGVWPQPQEVEEEVGPFPSRVAEPHEVLVEHVLVVSEEGLHPEPHTVDAPSPEVGRARKTRSRDESGEGRRRRCLSSTGGRAATPTCGQGPRCLVVEPTVPSVGVTRGLSPDGRSLSGEGNTGRTGSQDPGCHPPSDLSFQCVPCSHTTLVSDVGSRSADTGR